MIQKTFVGRSRELEKIRICLQDSPGKLILLTGAGGIGKTSLLAQVRQEYSIREDFFVELFDLAEQPVTLLNEAYHLANLLGRDNFSGFWQRLNTLDDSLDTSASADLEKGAVNIFVDEMVIFLQTQQKKLLRIVDTFEIILKYKQYGDNWVGGINEKLKNIPGVFFLVAGRDKVNEINVLDEISPILENIFGSENILFLPLSGFDIIEMGEFFEECDPHYKIPQEMREKLYLLTDGKPILLSLAIEWLQKNIPLPLLVEKSVEELKILLAEKAQRENLLNDFEFELVWKVRQLRTPFDVASLYMAHIDRRMDSRLLALLLGTNEAKAGEYLKQVLSLPFVKEYLGSLPPKCSLHDEMKELVKKHVWQHLDISGAERERLTRMVVEKYYLPRIKEFKKQKQELLHESQSTLLRDVEDRKNNLERWLLEAETLYYSIKISKDEGYRYFDRLYYDDETNPLRDQILIDEFKRAGVYDEDKISLRRADDLLRRKLRLADDLLRRGQREESRQECLTALKNDVVDDANHIHALNTLGLCDSEIDPFSAERYFKEALNIAQATDNLHMQMFVHNNLGRLCRNINRLDNSIEHLNAALDIAHRMGNNKMSASIRNNLAWTCRLTGDLDKAEALCNLSIAENRKYSQERPLAYAYLTKADIDRDKGDFHNAEQYAKKSLNIFYRLDDNEGRAQAYRTLANVSRHSQRYEDAIRYLKDAIFLIEEGNSLSLLASLYQLYGRTYRHYATYLQGEMTLGDDSTTAQESTLLNDALLALQKSIELSKKTGNRWESARSQIEIVLILMLSKEKYDESEVNDLLSRVWQTADELDDHLLKGYVHENYARIEMKKGNYFEAGKALGEAASHIVNRAGAEVKWAFDRIHNSLLDSSFDSEQYNSLAKGIHEGIMEQDDYQDYPKLVALVKMCEQIMDIHKAGGDVP